MTQKRASISVAMIARDEEASLPRTLESIRWVDEIVIVDSGSIDQTPAIAAAFGARHVFNRDFRGHAEQKNVAIGLCTSDWILLLDADEVVSAQLAAELQEVLSHSDFDAYWISRSNLFMTRWLRHGGFYPDRKLRLFQRGAARVEEGAGPHGTPLFSGASGTLKGDLLHYAYPSFDLYIEHMNRYSSEVADVVSAKGSRRDSIASFLGMAVLNPVLTFIKNYVFRLGFLDGIEGLLIHLNHSLYIHWKYAKIWEASSLRRKGWKLESIHPDVQSGLRARPPVDHE